MRSGVLLFLGLLAAMPAWALDKPEDIRACARKNFPATSSTQTFQLKTIGRDGSTRTLHATAFWKRASDGKAKVMLYVDQPDDLRGSSYLMLEKTTRDDLFMFLPSLPRVKRIHGSQTSDKLWGSDFSYEDIKQVQGIFDGGTLTRQPDAEISGRKTYVLDFVPAKIEESTYSRLQSYIDRETCTALRTDFFQSDGKARKRMIVNPQEVKQAGPRWVAHFYEMSDLLDETRTELRIEKMTADTDLPDRLFNPQTFYLGR